MNKKEYQQPTAVSILLEMEQMIAGSVEEGTTEPGFGKTTSKEIWETNS